MKQRQKFRANECEGDRTQNKYNEERNDHIELTSKPFLEQPTTETELRPGDTLQALSIRYQCPVAELKRLNNLHRDNEIHARRTIKVPFRPFSMVGVHKSGDNSPNANLTKKSVDADILKEKLSSVSTDISTNFTNGLTEHINVDPSCSRQEYSGDTSNFNEIIFNTRIATKEEYEEEAESHSDEEIQLLPHIEVAEPVKTEFNCNGHDWGLSWPILLGIILIVAFAGPLIYIVYIAEHPEKYHHS